MPTRFVILHHLSDAGEHWDLMLEHGPVLLTWQLLHEPIDHTSLPIPAKRIQDHRKAFLTYEGPLSADRGHVRRIDQGPVIFEKITENEYVFTPNGQRLTTPCRLRRTNADWTLEALPERADNERSS